MKTDMVYNKHGKYILAGHAGWGKKWVPYNKKFRILWIMTIP